MLSNESEKSLLDRLLKTMFGENCRICETSTEPKFILKKCPITESPRILHCVLGNDVGLSKIMPVKHGYLRMDAKLLRTREYESDTAWCRFSSKASVPTT